MKQIWKNGWKRVLALVLCLATILPMVPTIVFAESVEPAKTYFYLGDGVSTTRETFSSSNVVTGNDHIQLDLVTNRTIEGYGQYAFMSNAYGYIMAYDAKAKTPGTPNLASSLIYDASGGENTYYFGSFNADGTVNKDANNKNTIIIEHSDRDAALWVMRHTYKWNTGSSTSSPGDIKCYWYGGPTKCGSCNYCKTIQNYDLTVTTATNRRFIVGASNRQKYQNGSWVFDSSAKHDFYTSDSAVYLSAGYTDAALEREMGVAIFKGMQGNVSICDSNNINGYGVWVPADTLGWYWYTPRATVATEAGNAKWYGPNRNLIYNTKTSGILGRADNGNETYYPYFTARADKTPFKTVAGYYNMLLEDEWTTEDIEDSFHPGNHRIVSFSDGTFLVVFKMTASHDIRIMYCDENGNWGVRRYYDEWDGTGTGFHSPSTGYYPLSQLDDDLPMLKMKLYKYNNGSTVDKQVDAKGDSRFSVLAGAPAETVAKQISSTITVRDSSTGQVIPGNGVVDKVGYYHLNFANARNVKTDTNGKILLDNNGKIQLTGATTNLSSTVTPAGTYEIDVLYRNDTAPGATGATTLLGKIILVVESPKTISTTTVYVSQNALMTDQVYLDANGGTPMYIELSTTGTKIPVKVNMIRKKDSSNKYTLYIDTSVVTTITGTSICISDTQALKSNVTVQIVAKTFADAVAPYPAAGGIKYDKLGQVSTNWQTNGIANIQTSVTAKPVKGVDVLLVVDVSKNMRKTATGGSGCLETRYYIQQKQSDGKRVNPSWSQTAWEATRMYDMEEGIKALISALKATGSDVRLAISDFGDNDHYEVGGYMGNPIRLVGQADEEGPRGSVMMGSSSEGYGRWPFIDVNNNLSWDSSTEFPNHLNFVFSKNDTVFGPFATERHKYFSKEYVTTDSNGLKFYEDFWDAKDVKVYTGSEDYNKDAFVSVQKMDDKYQFGIIEKLRIQNSYDVASNYDIGLEAAYQLCRARQQANIQAGEDRDVVCIFMAGTAPTQYNYFSGGSASSSWAAYLNGDVTLNSRGYYFRLRNGLGATGNGAGNAALGSTTKGDGIPKVILDFTDAKKITSSKHYSWKKLFRYASEQGQSLSSWITSMRTPLSAAGTYDTYSPFYYFNHEDGKNWWAEAMKGSTNSYYPVINKYAKVGVEGNSSYWFYDQTEIEDRSNEPKRTLPTYFENLGRGRNGNGQSPFAYNGGTNYSDKYSGPNTSGLKLSGMDYISGYQGLDVTMYTIGYALRKDNNVTLAIQKGILERMATRNNETFCKYADDKQTLIEEFNELATALVSPASQAYYMDGLNSAKYSLVTSDTDTRTIEVRAYEIDEKGNRRTDENGNEIYKLLKHIEYDGSTATAYRWIQAKGGDTTHETFAPSTYSQVSGTILSGGVINDGDMLIYNTTDSEKIVTLEGQRYPIPAYTFFWRMGHIPGYEIVLDYNVYLKGSTEKTIANGTTAHRTTQAELNYKDVRGNLVTVKTKAPEFIWQNTLTTKYRVIVAAVDGTGQVKTNSSGKILYIDKDDQSKTTTSAGSALRIVSKATKQLPFWDQMWYLTKVSSGTTPVTTSGGNIYFKSAKDLTTDTTNIKSALTILPLDGGVTFDSSGRAKSATSGAYLKLVEVTAAQRGAAGNIFEETTNVDEAFTCPSGTTLLTGDQFSYTITGENKVAAQVRGTTTTTYTLKGSTLFGTAGDNDKAKYGLINSDAKATITSSTSAQSHTVALTGETTKSSGGTDLTSNTALGSNFIYFVVKEKYSEPYVNYCFTLNGTQIGEKKQMKFSLFGGSASTTTSITMADAMSNCGVSSSDYTCASGASLSVTSTYGSHQLTYAGTNVTAKKSDGTDVATGTGNLTDANLKAITVYIPVTVKSIPEVSFSYRYYVVDSNGKPIQSGTPSTTTTDPTQFTPAGNDPQSVSSAVQYATTNAAYGDNWFTPKTAAQMSVSTTTFNVSSADVTIQSKYSTGTDAHSLHLGKGVSVAYKSGNKTVVKTNEDITLSNDQLKDAVIYLPVQYKTDNTHKIQYRLYVADKDGNMVTTSEGTSDSPVWIPGNDAQPLSLPVSTWGPLTANNNKKASDLYDTLSSTNQGYYKEFGTDGYFTVDTFYESDKIKHTVKLNGKGMRLVNSSNSTVLLGGDTEVSKTIEGDLSAYTVCYPVCVNKIDVAITYYYYLVNSSGSPVMNGTNYRTVSAKGDASKTLYAPVNTAKTPWFDMSSATTSVDANLYTESTGGVKIESLYGASGDVHTLTITGNARVVKGKTIITKDSTNAAKALTNDELNGAVVYIPVTYKPYEHTIKYKNYLVDSEGNLVDKEGDDSDNPVLVGTQGTQKVAFNASHTSTSPKTTAMDKTGAQIYALAGSGIHDPFNSSQGSYSISTVFDDSHTITLSGEGMRLIDTSGAEVDYTSTKTVNNVVTKTFKADIDKLGNYTVCFPVTSKTEPHEIDYQFYLVDGSGDPVKKNNALVTWDIDVDAESVTLLATATAAQEWGSYTPDLTDSSSITAAHMELVGTDLTAKVLSQYGTDSHKLTLSTGKKILIKTGSAEPTAVTNSETTLNDTQLSTTVVYFPVKYKTIEATIDVKNYRANSSGVMVNTSNSTVGIESIEVISPSNGVTAAQTVKLSASGEVDTENMSASVVYGKMSSTNRKKYDVFAKDNCSYQITGTYDGTTASYTITLTGLGMRLLKKNGDKYTSEEFVDVKGDSKSINVNSLTDYVICFPVTIKQIPITVHFEFYDQDTKEVINKGTADSQTFLATKTYKNWLTFDDSDRPDTPDRFESTGTNNSFAVTSSNYAGHTVAITGKATLLLADKKTTITKDNIPTEALTHAQMNGATIRIPVKARTAETWRVKYGFYQVDVNGKPVGGNTAETATTIKNATEYSFTVNPADDWATIDMDNLDFGDYALLSGNSASVQAHFVNGNGKVLLSGTKVYYQQDGGEWKQENSGEVTKDNLAKITVWFPVFKDEVVINYGYYLVDGNGKALTANGAEADTFGDALKLKETDTKVVASNGGSKTVNSTDTYNTSTDLQTRFEVFNRSASYTVKTDWSKRTNNLTVNDTASPATTKIWDGSSKLESVPNVSTDDMDTYTVYFALKLNDLVKPDALVVDFGNPTASTVLENDIGLVNGEIVSISTTPGQLGYAPAQLVAAGAEQSHSHGKFWYLNKEDVNGDQVVYKTQNAQWSVPEVFYYCVVDTDGIGNYYYYGAVKVIPATTLYLEDDAGLVTYSAKMYTKDANGQKVEAVNNDPKYDWKPVGDTNDIVAEGGEVYGFSDAYANCTTYSMGGARCVKVVPDHFATATFSFKGTGFDLISMTNGTTGNIVVRVYNSGNQRVVNKTVDTYYGYKYVNGKWEADGKNSDSLYQVPVIKAVGLDYDTYRVEIGVSYAAFFDHNKNDEGFDFYLDAIRIYDPLNDGNGNAEIEKIYKDDHEGWPEYYELRNQIISTGNLDYSNDKMSVAGAVFIDRKGTTDNQKQDAALSITDYKNYGPKNELYLAKGQSVAFMLDVPNTTLDKVQIGLKSANGMTTKARIFQLSSVNGSPVAGKIFSKDIKTATEMYYDISTLNHGIVVITNASTTDSILSVTNIKATYTEAHTDGLAQAFGNLNVFEMVDDLGDVLPPPTVEGEPGADDGSDDTAVVRMTGASVSLKDEIFVNYYLYATGVEKKLDKNGSDFIAENGMKKATNVGLLLWHWKPDMSQDPAVLYEKAETIVAGALYDEAYGRCVIQTPGIPAKEMGDTIYACAYVEINGNYTLSKLSTYSPKTYCMNMLGEAAKKDITELNSFQKVLVAMLNYGTAAQEYFNYKVDIWLPRINGSLSKALKEVKYTDLSSVTPQGKAATVNTTINGIKYTKDTTASFGPTVSFSGALALNFYIRPGNQCSGNMTFYYWTEADYNEAKAKNLSGYTGMSVITKASDVTEFRAKINNIVAKDIDDMVYIAVAYTDSNKTNYVTDVYHYSVRNYCDSHAAATDPMSALAQATAVYGAYAENYFEPAAQ